MAVKNAAPENKFAPSFDASRGSSLKYLKLSGASKFQKERFRVGLPHHAAGKYLLVAGGGQVLARGMVLIKYLLLLQTY
jgi:hypothetical protein